MFSKSCEYAIRAVICISQKSRNGERVGVKELAGLIDAPEHFIAKILQILSRKGIVLSMKGPNGGFFVDKRKSKISLSSIVLAIDGDKLYDECVLGLKTCSSDTPCPVHREYQEIKFKLIDMLEHNTIENFNDLIERGECFLKND
ncbi:Rrf2 family transcriptional regulator [Marinilongibacter aquaticus]|uniref:RrF2 family transcriptional regulator n=1 Tax=Marinilongibacter aquaticus TaxID=2975157 RepID=UPI0021BDD186|nr:Rrf2 family transcriptional regulator [Marinilongibacter aquaticus]UBM60598.1 Rrf2 family transcriptional regulator [Marinilongibacter aquaticus]